MDFGSDIHYAVEKNYFEKLSKHIPLIAPISPYLSEYYYLLILMISAKNYILCY
jgi:hypothetical protein